MDAIAFDLDGTLIDISQRDYKIYSDIIVKFGLIPVPFKRYWELRINKTDIHDILSMSKFDFNNFDQFIDFRSQSMETLEYLQLDEIFKNVKQTLQLLVLDYNCFIVTTRQNRKNTLIQLYNLKLEHFFSEIFVTSENKELSFIKIKNLKYVVGDTENDILPAKKMGIKSIAVTTGIRAVKELEEMKPDFIVNDLIEVIGIVSLK